MDLFKWKNILPFRFLSPVGLFYRLKTVLLDSFLELSKGRCLIYMIGKRFLKKKQTLCFYRFQYSVLGQSICLLVMTLAVLSGSC